MRCSHEACGSYLSRNKARLDPERPIGTAGPLGPIGHHASSEAARAPCAPPLPGYAALAAAIQVNHILTIPIPKHRRRPIPA